MPGAFGSISPSTASWRRSRSSAPSSTQATQNTLARGERMVATLNQPQYQPWPHAEQVVAIYAGNQRPPRQDPGRAGAPLPRRAARAPALREDDLKAIDETGDLSDETAEKLDEELEQFQRVFNVEEEKGLAG